MVDITGEGDSLPYFRQKGGETMIDIHATRNRLRDSGRTIRGWARSHGFDSSKAVSIFAGRVKLPDEYRDLLRTENLLVEVAE